MRVGYARVSTSDQNPELQLEALRRAGCEKVFTEKASGARDDRPELARILADVLRAGDTLVVWRLDRLARSLKKLIATAEELEREKIGLVSLTESIDTTTPGGMLTFHVFGAIAQFERALIRERTTAGLIEARRQGRKGGRPPALRANDIAAARAMMTEGSLPVRDIAKRMGVSVATLYRYTGKRGSGAPVKSLPRRMADGKKRPPGEALVDLRRRLSLLPPRDPGRTEIIARAAQAYGISVWTMYRALRELNRPKSVRRSDHGATRIAPQAEMERYAEIVAALKLRTTNKKGRHVSTARAIEFLETDGVETPEGLVKVAPGLLKRATIDRLLRSSGLNYARATRPAAAVRFQARRSNELWHFDMSPSDLIRRDKRQRQRQAAPLRYGAAMGEGQAAPDGVTVQALLASCGSDLVGLRDAALISLAYDAGLRVSELVATCVGDLSQVADGSGRLEIARSKTDQEGEGAMAWLSPETMQRLSAWLTASGIAEGQVFRRINLLTRKGEGEGQQLVEHFIGPNPLTRQGVLAILRRRVLAAIDAGHVDLEPGREGETVAGLSAHSFRIGLTQDLFAAGEDGAGIALALRWSSQATALRYARELAVGSNAAARVLGKLRGGSAEGK